MMDESEDEDFRAQMSILRLAASGMDLRHSLTPEQIGFAPSLSLALDALDRVMMEMGFGDEKQASQRSTVRLSKLTMEPQS